MPGTSEAHWASGAASRSRRGARYHLKLYKPMLLKEAIVNGVVDEDLYQELCIAMLDCIQKFAI